MTARAWVGILAIGLGGGVGVVAQEWAPTLQASVDVSDLTVGDPVTLTVTVEHPPGAEVLWPESPPELSPFEVVGFSAASPATGGPTARSVGTFVLTAFETGELTVPAIDVPVRSPDGGEVETYTTAPIPVTVTSVLPDSAQNIRDIKPPRSIARNWWLVAGWMLLALAVAAAARWGWRRFARRPTAPAAPAAPPKPPRPAHEIALEALARLEQSDLLVRNQIKAYYSEAAEILRRYLDGRFGVDAMEMASPDILAAMRAVDIDSANRDRLRESLHRCDLVKFAKHRPTTDACAELVPLMRSFVEKTTPAPPAPAEPVATAAAPAMGEG